MRGRVPRRGGLLLGCLLLAWPVPGLLASDDILAWLYPKKVPGSLETSYEYAAPEGQVPEGEVQELRRLQVDGQVRLTTDSDHNAFISSSLIDLSYPTEIVLSPSNTVSRHLRSVMLGATYAYSDSVETFGLHIDGGSASDRLFANQDTLTYDATLFGKWPIAPHDNLVAFINYDNNRPYLRHWPLPALAIEHHPSDEFELMIGLPVFYMSWHPNYHFLLEASFIQSADMDIYAYVSRRWSISLSYSWFEQAFRRSRSPSAGHEIVFEDMRASLGISYDATADITVRALAGYLFNRSVYNGNDFFGFSKSHESLSLPAAPVASITFDIN